MNNQGEFNGYDYKATLDYFRFTLLDPNSKMADLTRAQWFERCHGISKGDFEKIVEEREPKWFYDLVMKTNRPLDLNQERKKK